MAEFRLGVASGCQAGCIKSRQVLLRQHTLRQSLIGCHMAHLLAVISFLIVVLDTQHRVTAFWQPTILQGTTDKVVRLCLDSSLSEYTGPFTVTTVATPATKDAPLFLSIGSFGSLSPTGYCVNLTDSSVWRWVGAKSTFEKVAVGAVGVDGVPIPISLPEPWDTVGWTMSLMPSFDLLRVLIHNKLPDHRTLYLQSGDSPQAVASVPNGDAGLIVQVDDIGFFSLAWLQRFLSQRVGDITSAEALVFLSEDNSSISYVLIEQAASAGISFNFVLFEAQGSVPLTGQKLFDTYVGFGSQVTACPDGCCFQHPGCKEPQCPFTCSCFCPLRGDGTKS